jgi:alpha-mannosidase
VLIETIKPCEDSDRAFIVRLYECEGSQAQAVLTTGFDVKRAATTDMLEVETEQLAPDNGQIALSFRPFEIKTLKFWY